MANQEQNPPQQEQPFVAAKQVGFNLEDILLNTNNEVSLLYSEHNNKDYFQCVSDFISKCCLRKPFTRSPNMYKEYLAEFWYSAKALENSKVFFLMPTGGIFREVGWFPTIGYREEVSAKGTLRKSLIPPSKEATKGGSSKAPTSSKTGHSKKRKDSNSAKDSNPSQPPVSTPVDIGMHKEDQQVTSGPTSLGVTSEARANPQLSSGNDASAASTAEADPGNSAPSDFTKPNLLVKGWKLSSLSLSQEKGPACFKDLDSPEDDPVIVVNDSDDDEDDEIHATKNVETEDIFVPKSSSPMSSQVQELTNQVLILQSQKYKLELEKNKAEAAILKAQPSFPNVEQLKELMVKSLKTEFSNILSAHDFSSSLPTELKDLPSKFNDLTEEAKLKTLDALPSLLNKVTNALNQFAQAITSKKTRGDSVPSAGQAGTQPAEELKNINQATISHLF
ncbi:hypothetical protein Tco_0138224 [Tanacetum coccineum]